MSGKVNIASNIAILLLSAVFAIKMGVDIYRDITLYNQGSVRTSFYDKTADVTCWTDESFNGKSTACLPNWLIHEKE